MAPKRKRASSTTRSVPRKKARPASSSRTAPRPASASRPDGRHFVSLTDGRRRANLLDGRRKANLASRKASAADKGRKSVASGIASKTASKTVPKTLSTSNVIVPSTRKPTAVSPPGGHYDVLQIGRHADEKVVRRAYRTRALATHPDKSGGSKVKFESVVAAYEVLIDRDSRAEYDASCVLDTRRDGMSWSDHTPGVARDAGMSASMSQQVAEESEDSLQVRKIAVRAWVKTFSVDIVQELADYSLLVLSSLLEFLNYHQREGNNEGSNMNPGERMDRAASAGGARRAAHVHYFPHRNAYKVLLQVNRLNISTQFTSAGNLKQALEWHEALLNMVAQAKCRAKQGTAGSESAEPLNVQELADALSEQPSMRLMFRIYVGTSRTLWAPVTRDINIALDFWRAGTFPTFAGWNKVKHRFIKQGKDGHAAHVEHLNRAIPAIHREIRNRAIATDRQSRSNVQLTQEVMLLKDGMKNQNDKLNSIAKTNRSLAETNKFLVNRVQSLEGKLMINDGSTTPQLPSTSISVRVAKAPTSQTSAARQPPMPAGGKGSAGAWAAGGNQSPATGRVSRPPVPDFNQQTSDQQQEAESRPSALRQRKAPAGDGEATPAIQRYQQSESSHSWWRVMFPQLPPAMQDVGLFLGHSILSYLSLIELDVLRATSKNMQAGRNIQAHERLRILYYSEDLYGSFSKRRYTRSGREVRPLWSMSDKASRTNAFLLHFGSFIEELQFGLAPCTLLEHDEMMNALSAISISSATLPGEGWSGIAAQRRVLGALRPGVAYQLMSRRGQVVRQGVAAR